MVSVDSLFFCALAMTTVAREDFKPRNGTTTAFTYGYVLFSVLVTNQILILVTKQILTSASFSLCEMSMYKIQRKILGL